MANIIFNEFSLESTDFSAIKARPEKAFVNEHFAMTLDVGPLINNFIKIGEVYHMAEGRVMWILNGSADLELTLEQLHVTKGDIMLVAPESILEIKSYTDDFTMTGFLFKDIAVEQSLLVHVEEQDWQESRRLARMLWDAATRTPFRREMVGHLTEAIVSDIQFISRRECELRPPRRRSRREETFSRFKRLVNQHCCQHRNISFYADALALTPHYLSALIAKVSGRSVMYWINRATLVRAKAMLKNKDTLVCEVADRLNFTSQSAFGLFFKRETGMTPSQYQKAD